MPRIPYFKVMYNGKDITADITRYLTRLTVSDKVHGESDEVAIELEDTEALWRGSWYPSKGDKLTIDLGYTDQAYSFGTFEIDEIEFKGPPDTVSIKGLAAGITPKLRTKRSSAHEGKTLKEIAQKIAESNGLTVQGEIENIRIGRVTQDRETDLGFLRRLASDYGYIFSVRDSKLIFTSIYKIEAAYASVTIDRSDIMGYSIKDTSADTYDSANVSYLDPESGETTNFKVDADKNTEHVFDPFKKYKPDSLVIKTKAENKQQAESKAKAALHKANSRQVTGNITLPGDPSLMSGVNVILTGFSKLSGKFNIESAEHKLDRSGGYVCNIEFKKVG